MDPPNVACNEKRFSCEGKRCSSSEWLSYAGSLPRENHLPRFVHISRTMLEGDAVSYIAVVRFTAPSLCCRSSKKPRSRQQKRKKGLLLVFVEKESLEALRQSGKRAFANCSNPYSQALVAAGSLNTPFPISYLSRRILGTSSLQNHYIYYILSPEVGVRRIHFRCNECK